MVVGLLAVGRAVAAGAEQGLDQSFLAWLWALLGGDAGPLLTQLEADAEVDDAYMICMTEVRTNPKCRSQYPTLTLLSTLSLAKCQRTASCTALH